MATAPLLRPYEAPPVSEPPVTRLLTLHDGRRLAFTERGLSDGFPVFHHHGMPGSRLQHEAEPEFYRSLGARVITPDRPGYGLSDLDPKSRLVDWPLDVLELADGLGIGRFGVTALSGGGIYAMACAAMIPDRLVDVVVTGCPAPMQIDGAFKSMRFMTRAGVWLGARTPRLLEMTGEAVSGFVRRHPRFVFEQFNRDKPPPDRRWLSMPSVADGAVDDLREGLRNGARGYVHDIELLARPWGFPVEAIRVPVQLWHGDADTVIPLHHGEYLASVIPGATLRVCPGEGHMVLWSHLQEILLAAGGMTPEWQPTTSSAPSGPSHQGPSTLVSVPSRGGHSTHPDWR
jgi:pimeloyl-ACP methyl ester carboxylesterase